MSDVPQRCPSCGTENPATARFCTNCGTGLTTPEPTPEPIPEPIPERRPSSSFPLWAVAAIVAVAVAAGVVAFVLTTRTTDSDTTNAVQSPASATVSSVSATATVEPTTSPTLAPIDELDALLPPEVKGCEETSVPPEPEFSEAIAVIQCDRPPGVPISTDVTAAFFIFPSEEAATASYEAIQGIVGLETDSGRCSNGKELGETGWSGDGGKGRLLCRPTELGSLLVWTSQGFPVLGIVNSANSVVDVYVVWQRISDYPRVG